MSGSHRPPRVDLPKRDVEHYYAVAIKLADEARRIAAPMLQRGFATETKRDASPVTEVDRAIERRLRELIAERFPDHGVIGEEYPPHQPESAFQWILDPIDGTEELIHGIPTWGAMLALHYDGAPVVGLIDHPALDVRASAGVGLGAWRNGQRIRMREPSSPTRPEAVRLVMSARLNFMRGIDEGNIFDALARHFPNHRIYRAAYAHTIVVTGAADAMVDAHNAIWDLAASQVLIEEAGGAYTVVRDMATQDGRMLSAVFGRRDVVEQLVHLF
jgi:fructose-1,6-bisphosphatase/inositol monophosphatase family enzyme